MRTPEQIVADATKYLPSLDGENNADRHARQVKHAEDVVRAAMLEAVREGMRRAADIAGRVWEAEEDNASDSAHYAQKQIARAAEQLTEKDL